MTDRRDPLTDEELVELLYEHVFRSAVEGVLSQMRAPSGRNPGSRRLRLNSWYNGLAPEDAERVREVTVDAAHAALFGLFAVVDGARAISDGFADEVRVLTVRGGETRDVSGDLHDIFQAITAERADLLSVDASPTALDD